MDLATAEGISRFLRSKDTDLADILRLSKRFLEKDKELYLPNWQTFLFLLICDRLNDTKGFNDWKSNVEILIIFNTLFDQMGNDSSRNRVMNKIKSIELVQHILNIENHDEHFSLLDQAFTILNRSLTGSNILFNDFSFLRLLMSFCKALQHIIVPNCNTTFINRWSSIIHQMYKLLKIRNKGKLQRSALMEYSETVSLPLRVISMCNDDGLSYTKDVIQEIFMECFITKENDWEMIEKFDMISKPEITYVPTIKVFFAIVLSSSAARNLQFVEELLAKIISFKEYQSVAIDLLNESQMRGISLSQAFYKKTLEEVLSRKEIDWDLTILLMQIDIDLTMEYAKTICNIIPVNNCEVIMKVTSLLLDSYTRTRNLPQFFTEYLIPLIIPKFESINDQILGLVATKVSGFSSVQLVELLKVLLLDSKCMNVITYILKGFTNIKKDTSARCMSHIVENLENICHISSEYWEPLYYCLNIYGNEIVERKRETLVKILRNSNYNNTYYYFCIFRSFELGLSDKLVDVESNFVDYLKINCENNEIITITMSRWFVTISKFSSVQNIDSITEMFINNMTTEYLSCFFQDNLYIFEQKRICDSIIRNMLDLILKPDNTEIIGKICINILLIPLECFSKSIKRKILDSLYSLLLGAENENVLLDIKNAMLHLLKVPSYGSRIEIDFTAIIGLFENSSYLPDSIDSKIIESVLEANIRSYKKSSCGAYIKELIEHLLDSMHSKKNSSIATAEFKISIIVLRAKDLRKIDFKEVNCMLPKFRDELFSSIQELILGLTSNLHVEYSIISWVLEALVDYSTQVDQNYKIQNLVKELGNILLHSNYTLEKQLFKNKLFEITCLISEVSNSNSKYLSALYLALTDSEYGSDREYDIYLTNYFKKLSDHIVEFLRLARYLIESVADEYSDKNNGTVIHLICLLVQTGSKSFKEDNQRLFVTTMSFLYSSLNFLSNNKQLLSDTLQFLDRMLIEKPWIMTQYSIEMLISFISNLSNRQDTSVSNYIECRNYALLTKVISSILLYHRFRLTSRHHMLICICSNLLRPLANHEKRGFGLKYKAEASSSYVRLIANLCEPSAMKLKKSTKTLNYSVGDIQKSLRKYLPVLLQNYIHVSLNETFDKDTTKELSMALYIIFDVLSFEEVQIASKLLDVPAKVYLKSLYTDYKIHGKWIDA